MCLKKWSCISWVREETGQQLVVCMTMAMVTCPVYRTWSTLQSDHVSNAYSYLATDFTTIHASDPHVSTSKTYDVYKLTLSTLRRQQCNVSTLHYIRFLRWPKKQLQGPSWWEKPPHNIWIWLPKKMCFKFALKVWQWWGGCDVVWETIPESQTSWGERTLPDGDKT